MYIHACICLLLLSLPLLVDSRPGIPERVDAQGEADLAGDRRVRRGAPPGKPWWWCYKFPKAPLCKTHGGPTEVSLSCKNNPIRYDTYVR